ncbi:MAG: flagellum-specific ATP synthase FliI [Gammaproteobacteria bacterium]|nr:MAG: flagellum-specific ATP synthase FliI [Gammaproteobacteria bacterium]
MSSLLARLEQAPETLRRQGQVVRAWGTSVIVSGLSAAIGQRCEILSPDGSQRQIADVVGIEEGHLILYPLGLLDGISNKSRVQLLDGDRSLPFHDDMLGRVLDGTGQVLQGPPMSARGITRIPIARDAPAPLERQPIRSFFDTGIRAIDGLLSVGVGQRIGIFATAGGGKSTLLSMLARAGTSDVFVIGLVGERGREVREFIDRHLGAEGMRRAVVVVSTSDRPAMERICAAQYATAIAEAFRDRGRNVTLMIDSITRYARALREVGLSIGEPPVRRGFPPSVFAELPRLFERAGNSHEGTITAFYTVLAEDDEGDDPIVEETRSILDGHISLSRKLGEAGHYPAIDILASTSRLFTEIASTEHQWYANRVRKLIARYRDTELLLQLGEYEAGSNADIDEAVEKHEAINAFLQQAHHEHSSRDATLQALGALA